jgi:hypothetical protein
MTKKTAFPQELLKQPIQMRLNYFRDRVFAHPRLAKIDREVTNAIRHPSEATLIFVYGPTGVGKTTMRLRVEKRLVELVLPELANDHCRLPYLSVEAVSPETGNFNWKEYYRRAFLALGENELLVEKKMPVWLRNESPGTKRLNLFNDHTRATDLRYALEEMLKYRKPLAFLIDEAQHLTKVAGGRALSDQMDHLKSLAGMTRTVHVLIGTYELATLARLSAQLARRSIGIHFSRYRFDDPEDTVAFHSILNTFEQYLPVQRMPDLVKDYEFLYESCSGCVGTLKGWINRALALALEAGDKTLARKHLEKSMDTQRLVQIAREIKEGEESLGDAQSQRTELRSLLGMVAKNEFSTSQPSHSKQHVGQRKPVRDLVGVNHA